jgi:GNAT superfamily N-acetyltransferase
MAVALLPSGRRLTLRPLAPDDRERLSRLFYRLSPVSVYRRFASPIPRPSDRCLDQLLRLDHVDREAIAAVEDGEIVAVARYARDAGADAAEVAVVVADDWQHRGVGRLLLRRLARLARRRGIRMFTGTAVGENRPVMDLLRSLAPNLRAHWASGQIDLEIPLVSDPPA